MLIKTNKGTNRRRLLRGLLGGAGVSVSLPFLDLFLDDNGEALATTGQDLPLRFGTWFWGLGIDPEPFTPKTTGVGYELPPQLAPLANVKDYVNVFTNYDVLTDGGPNLCHYTGWAALRTGIAPTSRDRRPGQSLDVPIAEVIGGGTRFRSISMAATGNPRDSYSFVSNDAVNPPEISALEFYQKIFGAEFVDPNSPNFTPDPRLMVRRSVLSGVGEQRRDFAQGLGAADRSRLDQYFTSIREIENRLELQLQRPAPAPTCRVPSAAPEEIAAGLDISLVSARHRAMTDLLVMALVCNQTKVFNMVYSDSASSLSRPGVERTHHTLTHEEPVDPTKGYQPSTFEFVMASMREWGYFLDAMKAAPEGDGNLLDRCLIYAHSDCQVAKVHSIDAIPMFTAGKLGGRVKTGMHLDGRGQQGTRLGFTLQRLMGVPIGSWGSGSMNATQEISEIIA